jgi:hypothetical protein
LFPSYIANEWCAFAAVANAAATAAQAAIEANRCCM